MRQPPTPSAPIPPAAARDVQIKIGKDGFVVLKPDDGQAIAALEAQAQLLKTRIASLKTEIGGVKAELSGRDAGLTIGANQVRLQALEGRRIDAEEALQKVEDQLAGIGVRASTIEEVGLPAPFEPTVPFDPNTDALQEKVAIIAVAAIVFIGAPIAIAVARFIWKRTTARSAPVPSTEDTQRLARVEQSVDTISLELERISEGQRFVSKVLASNVGYGSLGTTGALAQPEQGHGQRSKPPALDDR